MKLLAYIKELQSLPILSWSYQGLYQTMVQDQRPELTWELQKYLPSTFQSSLEEALWIILNHEDFKNHRSWKIHKERIILGIYRNEDVYVPSKFAWRKKILLNFKSGIVLEQIKIKENAFKFTSTTPPKDDDDDLPF